MLVICVEGIIYLWLYNLHGCTFQKINIDCDFHIMVHYKSTQNTNPLTNIFWFEFSTCNNFPAKFSKIFWSKNFMNKDWSHKFATHCPLIFISAYFRIISTTCCWSSISISVNLMQKETKKIKLWLFLFILILTVRFITWMA